MVDSAVAMGMLAWFFPHWGCAHLVLVCPGGLPGLCHGRKEPSIRKEVPQGMTALSFCPTGKMRLPRCRPCLSQPPLRPEASSLGRGLVHRLQLRQASSLSPAVPLSKLHTLVESVSWLRVNGVTMTMLPAPDHIGWLLPKSEDMHLCSDGVQETGTVSAKALGWNMASGTSPEKGSQLAWWPTITTESQPVLSEQSFGRGGRGGCNLCSDRLRRLSRLFKSQPPQPQGHLQPVRVLQSTTSLSRYHLVTGHYNTGKCSW